jgi:wyosine [tRNA(Phe)-imidazoG37] synthetase (radical SAM superfamily)
LERKEYVPFDALKEELTHYFTHNPRPDYVTFSGSGEPTLNSRIGDVVQFIKTQAPDIPIAVLTNGTLLFQKQTCEDIKDATVVIPSLDAATEKVFKKINQPHPQLKIDTIIKGLVQFRKGYLGQIWLEVFIVPGLNDTEKELTALKNAIRKIEPDRIQLNTLDRPGTVPTIQAATWQELERILDLWKFPNAEIIAKPQERKEVLSYRTDVESAILGTIKRRPCTLQDLSQLLGLHTNELNKYLDVLEADKKIKVVKQERGFFYQKTTPDE